MLFLALFIYLSTVSPFYIHLSQVENGNDCDPNSEVMAGLQPFRPTLYRSTYANWHPFREIMVRNREIFLTTNYLFIV